MKASQLSDAQMAFILKQGDEGMSIPEMRGEDIVAGTNALSRT